MDKSLFQRNLTLKDFLFKMGIQEAITTLLMTRSVPQNNPYWKGQESYIDGKVKFLSIPFWLQLCNQNGYSLELLLREENLQVMEQILHYSEEEEQEYISREECINRCCHIPLIQEKIAQLPVLATEIRKLIDTYPIYESLRRGNFLIYHIFLLVETIEEGLRLSYLLIDLVICGCIIDDLFDAADDRLTGDENILIELGDDLDAVNKVKVIFQKSSDRLQSSLPKINSYLDYTFNQVLAHYLFQTLNA